MNRLTAGLLLGLIAGVPAGAAIHAQYVRSEALAIQQTAVVDDRKPCKPFSKTEPYAREYGRAVAEAMLGTCTY